MAYSPFEKSYNSLNRSRSSSCSSPKTNRIFYQEVFSNGNDTLVRSFSCDQFSGKDDKGQTYQTVKYQICNFITPTKQSKKSVEVDNKAWSVPKTLAIEYPNRETHTSKARLSLKYPPDSKEESIGRNNSPIENESNSGDLKMKNRNFFIASVKYVLVPFLVLSLAHVILYQRQCQQSWDLAKLSNKLHESVFGQNEAVLKITNLMNDFNEKENSLVLMFTGDVGVGKTYTASIIEQNLSWATSESLSFTNYMGEHTLKDKFSTCGENLVIIDDISILDSTKAITFTKKIVDNKKVLIILIFRVRNKEQENLVIRQLQASQIDFYHLPFRNLEKDDILRCFNTEIKRLRVDVPEKKLVKLVEEQMTYIDVLRGSPGCKGIGDQILKFYSIS